MRKLTLIAMLALALSAPVLAGDTGTPPFACGGSGQPPCPPCTENCGNGLISRIGAEILLALINR